MMLFMNTAAGALRGTPITKWLKTGYNNNNYLFTKYWIAQEFAMVGYKVWSSRR